MGVLFFVELNRNVKTEVEKVILEKLGIYGWKEKDENLAFASLLTGDPLYRQIYQEFPSPPAGAGDMV